MRLYYIKVGYAGVFNTWASTVNLMLLSNKKKKKKKKKDNDTVRI